MLSDGYVTVFIFPLCSKNRRTSLLNKHKIKTVNITKIFLESVMKTVFYVKRTPMNSDVGSLTLLLGKRNSHYSSKICL